jgi:peroxin-1
MSTFLTIRKSSIQTLRTQFQFWLDKAMWHRPSVLIFDNLEKLLGTELEVLGSFYLSSTCSHGMDSTLTPSAHDNLPRPSCRFSLLRLPTTWLLTSSNIILVATAESQSALHPLVSASHLFKQVVHLKPPDKNARKQIIAQAVQRRLEAARNLEVEAEQPLNFVALATETEGYSATDLQDLVGRAVHQAVVRSSGDNDKVKLPETPPVMSVY